MERTFDRIPQFDERSRNYPIRALVGATQQPRSYTWACNTYNDQGQEGACVGFSWSHELSANPKPVYTDQNIAKSLYYRAQQLDPWPGEDYSGTSVLAGALAVRERGYMDEFRWAFSVDDLILGVGYKGPAVIGVDWYTNMFNTDPLGYLHCDGEIAGGHAILVRGFKFVKKDALKPISWDNMDRFKSYFTLHNSWGLGWGIAGTARVRVDSRSGEPAGGMTKLLRTGGEACIPVIRSLTPDS